MEQRDNMICIVGPTASGKTALSVRLAQALGGEIVSFDSMQVYRRMDIGTAKPTPEERGGVPHHMLDVADPAENYSVSRYVQEADACVQDILSRGKPVILVGGTGLYIDSLMAGRQFAPLPQTGRREALERRAAEEGAQPLLDELRAVDPERAARLAEDLAKGRFHAGLHGFGGRRQPLPAAIARAVIGKRQSVILQSSSITSRCVSAEKRKLPSAA